MIHDFRKRLFRPQMFTLFLLVLSCDKLISQDSTEQGVVIERVTRYFVAEQAGIKEGDIILNWSRGDAKGEISSPFDLIEIEIEQAPRGKVLLGGKRRGADQTWEMGQDKWGLKSRPRFNPEVLDSYKAGEALVQDGKPKEALAYWQTAAKRAKQAKLSVWLFYHAAEVLAEGQMWVESDQAYLQALEDSSALEQDVRVQLKQSWASRFLQRSNWEQAAQCYQEALSVVENFKPERLSAAGILAGLGEVTERRGQLDHAQKYYERSLAIRSSIAPNSLSVAGIFNKLAHLYYRRGDLIKTEGYSQQAITIEETFAFEGLDMASSLNELGLVALKRDHLDNAEQYLNKSLAIRQMLTPDSLDVAVSFNNLGLASYAREDLINAENFHRQALEIRNRVAPKSLDVSYSLNNLGNIARDRGDLMNAEMFYHDALAIKLTLAPESLDVASTFNNLGIVSWKRGDLGKAEDYTQKSLAIRRKLAPESLDVAISLANLGAVAADRGDLTGADRYNRQALAIEEKIAPNSLAIAYTLRNLGILAKEHGNLTGATQYVKRALKIQRQLSPRSLDVVSSLNRLGYIAQKRGDLAGAEEYFKQALEIERPLGPGSIDLAESLAALGQIKQALGQLDAASDLFAQASEGLEHYTNHLGGLAHERSLFRAEHASYYRDYIDVLCLQGKPDFAFQVLERSRARSMLELLTERDLIFAADLPPDIRLQRQQNAADFDRVQGQIARLNPKMDESKIDHLHKELQDLERARDEIREHIRLTSPRLAALEHPQPLGLEAARQVLDPGTVMLSYEVGPDHTILLVVQPQGQSPGVSAFKIAVSEKMLRKQVSRLRRLIQKADEGPAMEASERELYRLLVQPAESAIRSNDRLLIAPNGPLLVLPFAALKRASGEYLIHWKSLHMTLSATLYAEQKRMQPAEGSSATELVAFGDPVYLTGSQTQSSPAADNEIMSATERGLTLAPLPFSRKEVENIADLFSGHSRIYLGEQATEEHAKAVGKDARYLHFALHAFLDERFPLNSALVLTIPSANEEGKENGLLQAWEVFEQVRLNADLVTLSGCETGLGQELTGEGLIGLTQAFQYAGARSVVATLWRVDDYRTMKLMTRFYRELRAGVSKDEALRRAQLEMMETGFVKDWAGFSLAGYWN